VDRISKMPLLHAGHSSGLRPKMRSKAATQFLSLCVLGAGEAPSSSRQMGKVLAAACDEDAVVSDADEAVGEDVAEEAA